MKTTIRICSVLTILLLLACFVHAKEIQGAPLRDSDKQWINEVFWIISDYEKNAFLTLKSDDARDRFIKSFWENRDPTPGTAKNEFQEEHLRRYEYANKVLGRSTTIPGWKTDRGKIYILLGKPEFIKRNPNPFELNPMELWQYAGYRGYGLPGSMYLLFYQEQGVGDYKLYSPIQDGVRSLFTPQSASGAKTEDELYDILREKVDPEIAHASLSSIPTEGGDPTAPNVGLITAEMISAKIENAKNFDLAKRKYVEDFIFDRPSVQVYTSIDTGGIRDAIYWFQAPNGFFYIDYAVEYEPNKLDMGEYDNYYTSLTVDGAVATPEKVQVEQILSTHEINITPAQFEKAKSLPFQFQGRRPLFPGKYEVTMVMNNNVSRRSMTFTHDLDIPNPVTMTAPVISPLVALRSTEKAPEDETKLRPFQYGNQIDTPNVSGKYAQRSTMPLYHQVVFPPKFAPGDGALSLHYLILGAGKTEMDVAQPLTNPAADLAGNAIDVRKDILLAGVTLGTKQLTAELRAGEKVLARSQPVTLMIETEVGAGVWKYAVSIPGYDSSYHPLAIAQQLMALKKTNQALAVLADAYKSYPDSLEIRLQLMRAALRGEKFQTVIDLGTPMEVKNPRDTQLLWLLGWANYGLGKFEDAVRFFERYRIEDPRKLEVLNLLADIYFRLNQKDKSLERIQQSLALKPDQPDVLELKKQVEAPPQ